MDKINQNGPRIEEHTLRHTVRNILWKRSTIVAAYILCSICKIIFKLIKRVTSYSVVN